MKVNVGGVDKTARIVGGVVLLSLVFLLEGNFRWFGLIGLVPLATGLLGWCPLYSVLGIDTLMAQHSQHTKHIQHE